MTKKIFLLIALLIFSEGSMGAQRLGMWSEGLLFEGSHSAFRGVHFTKRFPSTLPIHQAPALSSRLVIPEGLHKRLFYSTSHTKTEQVFSRPTYDRIAKYVLAEDESVRVDILKAFTGISSLTSARQLDEHYNPFDTLHNLRKLINSTSFHTLFEKIRGSSEVELSLDGKKEKQSSEVLKGLGSLYSDLAHAFPNHRYRSTVDFLCETDFGYITIEFQVAKQDYWDKRALAYIASIYGNQLKPKQHYDQIQDVIGVNLLGDGSTPYWKDGRFIRDYTLVDQRGSGHKIPSLRLIQYSLGDVDLDHKDLKENEHLKQWIEFFKSAHEKESAPTSSHEPVRKAYDMIRVDTLKKKHPDLLKASDEFFASLTEHDQAVKEKSEEDVLKKVAKNMLKAGKTVEEVVKMTELPAEQIKKLK